MLWTFSTYSCPEQRQNALTLSAQVVPASVHAHGVLCDSSLTSVPKLTGITVKLFFSERKDGLNLVLHSCARNRAPNLQNYDIKGMSLLGVAGPVKAGGSKQKVIPDGTNFSPLCLMAYIFFFIFSNMSPSDTLTHSEHLCF